MDLQLHEPQNEINNGIPPLTEAIQMFGSTPMNLLKMLECLLSKEKLWFEEIDSSCQRTFENYKQEGEMEKARNCGFFGVPITEVSTSTYRQMVQSSLRL